MITFPKVSKSSSFLKIIESALIPLGEDVLTIAEQTSLLALQAMMNKLVSKI
jgi:hypothetical protein